MSRDALQDRLSRLADTADGLDANARARVVDRVGEAGPAIVRRARVRRVAIRVGGVALAIGIIAFLAIGLPPAGSGDSRIAPIAEGPRPDAAARACESWTAATETALGPRGTVTRELGTDAHIVGESGCRTVVALDQGRVTVQADDLGGGTLIVRTVQGDVSVHGTVFSVTARSDAVTIEVEEGRVAWTATGEAPVYLGANERLVVERSSAQAEATPSSNPLRDGVVAADRRQAKKRRPAKKKLRAAEKKSPAQPNSGDLVRRAEALRRAGNPPGARAAYRAAGQLGDSTGEAAWIALARYELELSQPRGALRALKQRNRRFGKGTLELEAEWIAVRALSAAGELTRAKQRARQIIVRWPRSPQAQAAKSWLEAHP